MKRYEAIIDRFKNRKVMVLGDFVLDEYIYGETERISREAPVLILRHRKSVYLAGGGANPVMNIRDLGAEPIPVAVVGNDEYSEILLDMMKKKGIDTSHIIRTENYSVPLKTRVMAGSVHTVKQQIVRIDRYYEEDVDPAVEQMLIGSINRAAKNVDVILVSDYDGGIITDRAIKAVNALAKAGKKVVVDSRYGLKKYKYVATATPNETEAGPAVGHEKYGEEDVELIVKKLAKVMKGTGMIVTRGSRGMIVLEKGKVSRIPAYGTDEIVDVSGAGDTVSSIIATALACGASLVDAAFLANIGGGLVVMKRGAATVPVHELKGALKNVKA
ncbi:MAG: PfkB family carbohydrate kinase [Spirochaetia bacterium]|nr:PfkB family carbohydrate kinase [Spirochaetia bacterium]